MNAKNSLKKAQKSELAKVKKSIAYIASRGGIYHMYPGHILRETKHALMEEGYRVYLSSGGFGESVTDIYWDTIQPKKKFLGIF